MSRWVFIVWILAILEVMGFLVGYGFYELLAAATELGRGVILFVIPGAVMFIVGVVQVMSSKRRVLRGE